MDFIELCIKNKIVVQSPNGELRPIDELQLEYAAVNMPPTVDESKTENARINSYMRKYTLKQMEDKCKEIGLSSVDSQGKPLPKRPLAMLLLANKH
nr:hypothetical protein SDDV_ORF094 [Scale drop disease virus]